MKVVVLLNVLILLSLVALFVYCKCSNNKDQVSLTSSSDDPFSNMFRCLNDCAKNCSGPYGGVACLQGCTKKCI